MTEHAGYTQPVSRADIVRNLYLGLNDADKILTKYNLRRDKIIDELMAMGEI